MHRTHSPTRLPPLIFSQGRYSCVAGFVDVGETFEQGVAREVHEETGLHVRRVRYGK